MLGPGEMGTGGSQGDHQLLSDTGFVVPLASDGAASAGPIPWGAAGTAQHWELTREIVELTPQVGRAAWSGAEPGWRSMSLCPSSGLGDIRTVSGRALPAPPHIHYPVMGGMQQKRL